MPRTKDAYIRYRIINQLLVNQPFVTIRQIMDRCEEVLDKRPMKRTVMKDIEDMRYDRGLNFHAPIAYNRQNKGYCYEDPSYSIDRIPLDEEELKAVNFAAAVLQQYRDIPWFETFSGAVQKIADALRVRKWKNENQTLDFIDFEKVPYVKGSEFLPVLVDAIHGKKVLRITHRPFNHDHAHTHVVHPYLLKEYRNRWYLAGHHAEYREMRTFGLDRIVSVEEEAGKAYREPEGEPQDHFRNTIGVFAPPGKPPRIVLKFSARQAPYVLTQPLHESQQTLSTGATGTIIELRVHPTYELVAWVLGQGRDVEVLRPASLRRKISGEIRKTLLLYGQD